MAETRFGQLPPGQHFRWKGKQWQKTSPLIAREEGTDEPKMIPRSAVVAMDDALQPATNSHGDHIEADALSRALQKIQQESLAEIELLQLESDKIQAIKKILGRAVDNALNKS